MPRAKLTPEQKKELARDRRDIIKRSSKVWSADHIVKAAADSWLESTAEGKRREIAYRAWVKECSEQEAVSYLKEATIMQTAVGLANVAATARVRWTFCTRTGRDSFVVSGGNPYDYPSQPVRTVGVEELRLEMLAADDECQLMLEKACTLGVRKTAAKAESVRLATVEPSRAPVDDGTKEWKAYERAVGMHASVRAEHDAACAKRDAKRARFLGKAGAGDVEEEEEDEDE